MHDVRTERAVRDADDAFERRLDQALATSAMPAIPADFATRVAGLVPSSRPVTLASTEYARNSMILCGVVLLIALLLLAPRAAGALSFATALEWILCGQLSLLVLYGISSWSPWNSRK